MERARALFYWVADNIAYDFIVLAKRKNDREKELGPPSGLMIDWSSRTNSQAALDVLAKRRAVCEGYAKLFV